MGGQMPQGVAAAQARVNLVQNTPKHLRAHGAFARRRAYCVAGAKAGKLGQHAQATQF